MKNIKTLLSLLGTISLSIGATSSVVACGGGKETTSESTHKPNNIIKMDTQVKKDFYFLDENNNSTISLKIQVKTNDYYKM